MYFYWVCLKKHWVHFPSNSQNDLMLAINKKGKELVMSFLLENY